LKREEHYKPVLLATAGVERMSEPRSVTQMPQKRFPKFIMIKIFSTRHFPALETLPTHQSGRLCLQSGGGGDDGAL
jgi:hypothetical protein